MRLLLSLVLFLAACSKPKPAEPPAPPPVQRTAPMEEVAPFNTAQLDVAKVKLDLAAARAGIAAYQQTNEGKNPPSLSALDLQLSFPGDLRYDAAAGTVKSGTYPTF